MIDDFNIYDGIKGTFTTDSAENIIRSIKNIVDIDEIYEIVLLSATPFTIENFLDIKEQIVNGTFKPAKINFTIQTDLLLFYQVQTVSNKYYAIAHRDPFELYYNEVIMWFHKLDYNYISYPPENRIYNNTSVIVDNN